MIFDSRVPIGDGQAVYVAGAAAELAGDELGRGIGVFSRVSVSHGARPWSLEDVRPPGEVRLFRARASGHWVLDPDRRPDQRTPVNP